MAQTKLATIRYQALDKCFSNWGRHYYIEDLIEACNRSLQEYLGADACVKRRQVFDDIKFMESESGWSVELEKVRDGKRVYYRYADRNFSINQRPMSEYEARQIKETLLTLQRFKGMPHFEWIEEVSNRIEATYHLGLETESVVSFQNNPYLKGLEFFQQIFNAIVNHRCLRIHYVPFEKPEKTLTISPYFLKQYNNRWFLFGTLLGAKIRTNLTNLPLDRILSVEEIDDTFIPYDGEVSFEDYFEDVVGVSVDAAAPTLDVTLKVTAKQAKYIRNKPLHESQSENHDYSEPGYAEFHLQVKDNYELRSLLLSIGPDLEVVSPESLRTEIADAISQMRAKYE